MRWILSLLLSLLLSTLLLKSAYGNALGEALEAVEKVQNLSKAQQIARQASAGLEDWEKSIVYDALGWRLNREKEYKLAERSFRKARKLSGNHYEVIGIAIALFNQGRYDDSLKTLKKMLKRDSRSAVPKAIKEAANYVLGINYQQLERLPQACIHWDRSFRLTIRKSDPNSYGIKSRQLIREHC
jgi:tetratricopeptide (TPR) repeat protein